MARLPSTRSVRTVRERSVAATLRAALRHRRKVSSSKASVTAVPNRRPRSVPPVSKRGSVCDGTPPLNESCSTCAERGYRRYAQGAVPPPLVHPRHQNVQPADQKCAACLNDKRFLRWYTSLPPRMLILFERGASLLRARCCSASLEEVPSTCAGSDSRPGTTQRIAVETILLKGGGGVIFSKREAHV